VASSKKIREELGWAPNFPDLETIVETAWKWHREHPKGYDDK
jgi:UDP-glucose 4-epimerase